MTRAKKPSYLGAVVGLALFLAIVGSCIWWEVGLWRDCRATNGFWYCVRVLNR